MLNPTLDHSILWSAGSQNGLIQCSNVMLRLRRSRVRGQQSLYLEEEYFTTMDFEDVAVVEKRKYVDYCRVRVTASGIFRREQFTLKNE